MNESEAIAAERAMLLRYCVRYTGDPDTAEDLVQATLLQAWRHEEQLRDPQARQGWLLGIARNTCAMWGRRQGLERSRRAEYGWADETSLHDRLAGDVDLEVELERDELTDLLDRALALLPAETREVLIRRYVDEAPQAEIAARLQLSEGAVEGRLHRGKLALRGVLTNELSHAAISYGLISSDDAGWQTTRIWCPGCGKQRLLGQFGPDQGSLTMRCPSCAHPYPHYIGAHGWNWGELRTFKPALSQVLTQIHQTFRIRLVDGALQCFDCDTLVSIRHADGPCIVLECPVCRWRDVETWHSLTWSLPETRAFWRKHPRMRYLPHQDIEYEGAPAVLTGFENLAGTARLEVVSLRDTLQVVRVSNAPLPLRSTPLP